ncbi:MAG: flagellar FlbD family protein [Brevinematales bacterium]
MIELTRLNNTKFTINMFLVEFLEETPDTIIVFQSGHKMVCKEKTAEIRQMFSEFLSRTVKGNI